MTDNRKQAAIEGKATYLGHACKRCGQEIRYVCNTGCVACSKQRAIDQRNAFFREVQDTKDQQKAPAA